MSSGDIAVDFCEMTMVSRRVYRLCLPLSVGDVANHVEVFVGVSDIHWLCVGERFL